MENITLESLGIKSPLEFIKAEFHETCTECNPVGTMKCNHCGLQGSELEIEGHECHYDNPDQYGK